MVSVSVEVVGFIGHRKLSLFVIAGQMVTTQIKGTMIELEEFQPLIQTFIVLFKLCMMGFKIIFFLVF